MKEQKTESHDIHRIINKEAVRIVTKIEYVNCLGYFWCIFYAGLQSCRTVCNELIGAYLADFLQSKFFWTHWMVICRIFPPKLDRFHTTEIYVIRYNSFFLDRTNQRISSNPHLQKCLGNWVSIWLTSLQNVLLWFLSKTAKLTPRNKSETIIKNIINNLSANFQRFLNKQSFFLPTINFCENIFVCDHISTFCKPWSLTPSERLKKTKHGLV